MGTDEERPTPSTEDSGETGYGQTDAFRPAKQEPLLARAVPISREVPGYRVPAASRDLLAGLTVAALALPSAMAYGQLAGLSPVNGLYTLLLPTIAYVFLGSSRRLVIGPEGATSTLVAAAVLPLAVAGSDDAAELASMLALLVAACFLLARVLRLGWMADYFSRPVLIGYLHGVAITLVIAQLGKLLGTPDRRARAAGAALGGGARAGRREWHHARGQRCLARRAVLPPSFPADRARSADRGRRGDRPLLVARPRQPRRRDRRPGRERPAPADASDAAARPTSCSSCPRRSACSSSRLPMRS